MILRLAAMLCELAAVGGGVYLAIWTLGHGHPVLGAWLAIMAGLACSITTFQKLVPPAETPAQRAYLESVKRAGSLERERIRKSAISTAPPEPPVRPGGIWP